jgi:nucleotide-binding universal stress UspA family protein
MSSSLFSRIIVGVDDSEPSQRAVDFALRIAAQYKGQVTAVHGVDWASAVSSLEAGLSVADPQPVVDALRTEGRALLANVTAQARSAGIACDEQLIDGTPVDAILTAAKKAGALVIVLGTHGRGGFARLVLGSVAESTIRSSEIPVLAVHPKDELPPASQPLFEKVVAAVDSHESGRAVQIAKAPMSVDRAVDYARGHLETEGSPVEGKAADAIVAEAKNRGAALIVMGTRGRPGLERFFSGSVTENVLQTAPVPVLIVHPSG